MADTKFTPEIKSKLEELAELDASVAEMAMYCDVSRQTIYNWKEENPDFFDRLERLRETPILTARRTVIEKATESYSNAMDFLKRKRKLEFGDNIDVTSEGKEIKPIYGGLSIQGHNSNAEDISAE